MVPLSIVDLGLAEDGTGERERSPSHNRRLRRHKIPVVQGDLANVGRHVLNLSAVTLLGHNQLGEEVDRRVANVPVQGVEDVHLHLGKHARIVESATHVVKLVDLRYSVLLVAVLGGNEESSAADELIVLLVDDTLGAVPIEKVDGEEEGLGKERKGGMSFDEKVDEIRSHKPLDLPLHVDQVGIRQRLVLHVTHVLHDILQVLVVGQSRELVGDHLLLVAGDHPAGVAHGHALGGLVLDEEGLIG